MTEEQRRRLSAVMFTDVVGYTALMQGDEEAARLVRLRHRAALEAAITAHGGELVQYLGDGSLSTFPSAVRAVSAAVEVQRALREAVPLRIGIHQGEIAFDDQGIYGDSVNVASRVMGLGTPGSVLVSEKTHDELKNQRDFKTASLGHFDLKNVKHPMVVHAVRHEGLDVPTREDVLAQGRRPGRSLLVATPLAAVLLTIIGFLATRVYDVKLAMPAEYTPSRLDFPLVGLQAVLPVLVNAFAAFVVFVALKYLWRLSNLGVRRLPGVGDTIDSWREALHDAGRKVWTVSSPTTIADLFFVGAIIASLVVLALFREFIDAAVWEIGPTRGDKELLFCWHWPLHQNYVRSLTLLIMGISFAWYHVFSFLRAQGVATSRIGGSMWGSLGLIFILLLLVTMPWRLLNDNDHSRVRLDGERAYILVETEAELVIYHGEIGSTARYRKGTGLNLDRIGTDGYLFEGPSQFDAGWDHAFRCLE